MSWRITVNKSTFGQISEGDYLSETQYYKVIGKTHDRITVTNDRDFTFYITNTIVEEGLYSANQYHETIEVTRTGLIEQFSKVGDTVFTVCFNKQPTATSINQAIDAAIKQDRNIPAKDLKKIVKDAYAGELRVLIGRMVSIENGFGRSTVIDLQVEKGKKPEYDGRIRLVDHRTLNWLICKNKKYVLK